MSEPRDEIAEVLDPHWRTDCSHAEGDTYVRWVKCRCGWASEPSESRINMPDMHRIWNEHLATVLAERDRRVAGAAWDEGANAAVEPVNAGTRMTLRAVLPFPSNPYREATP